MRSLLQRLIVIGTGLLLCAATSCAGSPASLVGTYSVEEHGQRKEFIRIEKQGDRYFLSENLRGEWLSPKEVTPVSKVDLEKVIKEPIKVEFTGLGNDKVALLQVPKGWKLGQFVCNTGFWLASMLGPIELHKK